MDREKVIKGLDVCLNNIDQPDCPNDCPYLSDCSKYENRVVFQPLMRDALAILKEQEALAVREDEVNKCVCGMGINRYWHLEYCGFCGKKLEWY